MDSPDLTTKRRFVITLGLMIGTAALTIDVSLPAVPPMSEAFGTSVSNGQRIVGIFMAGMALGQIPAGLLSDRFGRLPVLFGGTILFLIAGIVAAMSNDIHTMLTARFFQGMSAAAAIVLSRAIVRDVASGDAAARLMSMVAMIFTAVPVIAPTIGAALISVWGWRSPFVFVVIFGFVMLIAVRLNVPETHSPRPTERAWAQLRRSFREFFSHRQSIFGLLFIILPPIGFMSVITMSSSLVVETYGLSLQTFGYLFIGFGVSILLGSASSRVLAGRLDIFRLIKLAVVAISVAGLQLGAMAVLNDAPLWWLWSAICLFMYAVGILITNATVLALDPLPQVAGVASSILGTLQNITGALGALGAAWLYTGSVRNSVILMAFAALSTAIVMLLKPVICPKVSVPAT